jgi:chromosome segregation ATPase
MPITRHAIVFNKETITATQVETIAEQLAQNPAIDRFTFSNCKFTGDSFEKLLDKMRSKPIDSLTIQNNNLTPYQLDRLQDFLKEQVITEYFSLEMENISKNAGLIKLLAERNLPHITLDSVVTPAVLQGFAASFVANKKTNVLTIYKVNDSLIEHVASILITNQTLKYLTIRSQEKDGAALAQTKYAELSIDSAKKLADAIAINKSLEILDLGCTLDPEGLKAILEAAKSNATLETFTYAIDRADPKMAEIIQLIDKINPGQKDLKSQDKAAQNHEEAIEAHREKLLADKEALEAQAKREEEEAPKREQEELSRRAKEMAKKVADLERIKSEIGEKLDEIKEVKKLLTELFHNEVHLFKDFTAKGQNTIALSEELDKAKDEEKKQAAEIKAIKIKLDKLNQDKLAEEANLIKATEALTANKAQQHTILHDLQENKKNAEDLAQQLNSLKANYSANGKIIIETEAELDNLKQTTSQNEAITKEIDLLKNQNQVKKVEILSVQQSLDANILEQNAISINLEKNNQAIEESNKKILELKVTKEDVENGITSLNKDLEENISRKQLLSNSLKQNTKEAAELEQKLKEAKTKDDEKQAEIQKAQSKAKENDADQDGINKAIRTFEDENLSANQWIDKIPFLVSEVQIAAHSTIATKILEKKSWYKDLLNFFNGLFNKGKKTPSKKKIDDDAPADDTVQTNDALLANEKEGMMKAIHDNNQSIAQNKELLKTAETEAARIQEELQTLTDEASMIEDTIKQIEQEKIQKETDVAEQKSSLDKAEAEEALIQQNLKNLGDEQTQIQSELTDTTTANAELKSIIKEETDKLDALNIEKSRFENQIATLDTTVQENTSRLTDLKKQVDDMLSFDSEKERVLTEKLQNIIATKEKINIEITDIQKKNTAILEQIKTTEISAADAESAELKINKKVENSKSELAKIAKLSTEMEKQTAALNQEPGLREKLTRLKLEAFKAQEDTEDAMAKIIESATKKQAHKEVHKTLYHEYSALEENLKNFVDIDPTIHDLITKTHADGEEAMGLCHLF